MYCLLIIVILKKEEKCHLFECDVIDDANRNAGDDVICNVPEMEGLHAIAVTTLSYGGGCLCK